MQNNDSSNTLFDLAVKFVNQTAKHLFITGKAGTGKTTFLRHIKNNCFKRLIIIAPTGVAAINAGGVTIHSFFQLPFGPFIADHRTGWNSEYQKVTNLHSLLKNIRFTADKRKIIEELELIIIDEVSMMRCDTLDAIDQVLRHFRKNHDTPFGGVQMVYIGDLHQLPPVIKNAEWELLRDSYSNPFFFNAKALQQQPPLYLELKKIYRQSDQVFIELLNNIRHGNASPEDLALLHQHYSPGFHPQHGQHYITLTSHNAKADEINNNELTKLPGEPLRYTGEITGEFNENALPAELTLNLKEGAQIMFLKNDKGEKRRFFNGKIGVISKLTSAQIIVSFPDSGNELEIEKETWTNIRYRLNPETNKLEEEEIGSFSQYPIRLAWAITIHKSQGLTFDRAIIDAGASFAAGQVYVALSRLTSLNGLVLKSRIEPGCISTDQRILQFMQTGQAEDELIRVLEAEQAIYSNRMLLRTFEWTSLINAGRQLLGNYDARKIPEKEEALAWAQELFTTIRLQHETASRFSKQLKQLLISDAENNFLQLISRVQSAQQYFDEQLLQTTTSIEHHLLHYSTKKKTKKYLGELKVFAGVFERKRKELINALEMARDLHRLREKDRASMVNQELPHISPDPKSLRSAEPLHQ